MRLEGDLSPAANQVAAAAAAAGGALLGWVHCCSDAILEVIRHAWQCWGAPRGLAGPGGKARMQHRLPGGAHACCKYLHR